MSIELSSASANILFNSVNQQRLQKKLLTNDNFEIVKTGAFSDTDRGNGETIVRTKKVVGADPITDEPIYEYTEFPIKHPREDIAEVFRRRLPRDAKGQLTVAANVTNMTTLNAALAAFDIYLEPSEFTVIRHGDAAVLTAKPTCILFYGKIGVSTKPKVTDPIEVFEAETPDEGEEGGSTTPPVIPPNNLSVVKNGNKLTLNFDRPVTLNGVPLNNYNGTPLALIKLISNNQSELLDVAIVNNNIGITKTNKSLTITLNPGFFDKDVFTMLDDSLVGEGDSWSGNDDGVYRVDMGILTTSFASVDNAPLTGGDSTVKLTVYTNQYGVKTHLDQADYASATIYGTFENPIPVGN